MPSPAPSSSRSRQVPESQKKKNKKKGSYLKAARSCSSFALGSPRGQEQTMGRCLQSMTFIETSAYCVKSAWRTPARPQQRRFEPQSCYSPGETGASKSERGREKIKHRFREKDGTETNLNALKIWGLHVLPPHQQTPIRQQQRPLQTSTAPICYLLLICPLIYFF